MIDNKVFKFKQFYAKFLKIDKYMCEKRCRVDSTSANWKEVEKKFWQDSVEPLERIWSKLSKDEKKEFCIQMGWGV